MPRQAAALQSSPGANRPTSNIGLKASWYTRSEHPNSRNSSLAVPMTNCKYSMWEWSNFFHLFPRCQSKTMCYILHEYFVCLTGMYLEAYLHRSLAMLCHCCQNQSLPHIWKIFSQKDCCHSISSQLLLVITEHPVWKWLKQAQFPFQQNIVP